MKKSRLNFLKTIGVLAIGAYVAPLAKLSAKNFLSSSSKRTNVIPIKAILVGAGDRGNRFGKYALSNANQLQIVGVADAKDPLRAKAFAKKQGISNHDCAVQAKDLYKRPKFADVVILTEHVYNPSLAIEALKAGYEVWMDQAFLSNRTTQEVDAAAQLYAGSIKVVHIINKDVLHPQSRQQAVVEKQAIFSSNCQSGDSPFYLVLG